MTDEIRDDGTHPEWEMHQVEGEDGEITEIPVDEDEERFGPWTGQPQIEEQPDTVAENTAEQESAFQANERQAALEATWPIYTVVISGEDTLWVARPGQNIQPETGRVTLTLKIPGPVVQVNTETGEEEPTWVEDTVFDEIVQAGDPAPWIMKAKATVDCKAPSAEYAKMMALRANPEYHTVISVKKATKK